MKAVPEMVVGSRWHAVGETTEGPLGVIRVMAVVEGWVVARRNGCMPFLVYGRDWHRLYDQGENPWYIAISTPSHNPEGQDAGVRA